MSGDSEFQIPEGYYIDIHGAPNPVSTRYRANAHGESIVTIYKNLERHSHDRVLHVSKVGSFNLENVNEMDTKEFLRKIREGIEGIVASGSK